MRKSHLCLALVMPLSLLWACGSSGGDASFDGNGKGGTDNGAAGSLAFGGDGLGLDFGGEGSGVGLGGSTGAGSTASGGGSDNGGSTATGGVAATGDTACSNGLDDDGDGLIDGFDPECTGAGDDDEASYATGIPGDNRDGKWQDCFFDGNSGAGDDGCRYHTDCLTGKLAPDAPDCTLTQACLDFCAPLAPNGCDCFGCCTVQDRNGGTVDVQTVSSCSTDKLGDEDACPRCVKTEICGNTCGRCELCPGKTLADLPADCSPPDTGTGGTTGTGGSGSTGGTGSGGGPAYSCDDGEQVCGPDLPACPSGQYCSFGCCLLKPPK